MDPTVKSGKTKKLSPIRVSDKQVHRGESSAENAAEWAEKDGGSINKRWLAFNRHRKPAIQNSKTVKTAPPQFIPTSTAVLHRLSGPPRNRLMYGCNVSFSLKSVWSQMYNKLLAPTSFSNVLLRSLPID